jgi:outer membrane biosynthesis protein TonB
VVAFGRCTGWSALTVVGLSLSTVTASAEQVAPVSRLRVAPLPVLAGRLPPQTIRRLVRQQFGRFRGCYVDGARRNASLSGRVAVRFVIGRDGAVYRAEDAGSDLPDPAVIACVVSAFAELSFPAPDDGLVFVHYPIVFSRRTTGAMAESTASPT